MRLKNFPRLLQAVSFRSRSINPRQFATELPSPQGCQLVLMALNLVSQTESCVELRRISGKIFNSSTEKVSKADLENGFKLTEYFIKKNLQPVKRFQMEPFFSLRNRLLCLKT